MLSVTATDTNGNKHIIANCVQLNLVRSLDSPATGLTASFAIPKITPNFAYIGVFSNNNLLFCGNVDEQEYSISSRGSLLSLDARSLGAAALDNEARPRTLWGANLTTMFSILLKPYGLKIQNKMPLATLPVFTIFKGMSAWEAFANFTARMHSVKPHIHNDFVVIGRPDYGPKLVFSNSKRGNIPFCSLTHRHTPYKLLSKIYLRDAEGYYSSSVQNPAAMRLGIQRERYLIPASEYASTLNTDANLRIQRAQYQSSAVILICPGIINAVPGQQASVEDITVSHQNLIIDEMRYSIGEKGIFTEFTLREWLYYG